MRLFLAGLVFAISLGSGWSEEPVSRIGFGSCYKPDKKTPLWKAVSEFKPEVWLWLGDNVYADVINGKYVKQDLPKDAFERAYRLLKQSEGIATLRNIPSDHMMATWDDHDFGRNDIGKSWGRKEDAKKAFVKFWGGEEKSDGVYSSRNFGPEGKRVRVILLDTRFNRDDPGPEGDVLGEKQWKWLEGELKQPGADLVVIGSSIQVLAQEHRFEKWGNFPKAKDRLYQAIRESGARGVIFISGDRHNGEISCQKDTAVGYPLYDVTSSGLTEVSSLREDPNALRVGSLLNAQNFGAIQINWSQPDPEVSLELHDAEGKVREKITVPLSQLAPPKG